MIKKLLIVALLLLLSTGAVAGPPALLSSSVGNVSGGADCITPVGTLKWLIHSDTTNGDTNVTEEVLNDTATCSGCSHSTATAYFGATSLYFPGPASGTPRVDFLGGASYNLNAGDSTKSLWYRYSSANVNNSTIQAHNSLSYSKIYHSSVATTIAADSGGVSTCITQATHGWTNGTWHHVAVVVDDGTSGKLYLDGVLKATQNSANCGGGSHTDLHIGNRSAGRTDSMVGYLDEIMGSQAQEWTSNFTPPDKVWCNP